MFSIVYIVMFFIVGIMVGVYTTYITDTFDSDDFLDFWGIGAVSFGLGAIWPVTLLMAFFVVIAKIITPKVIDYIKERNK